MASTTIEEALRDRSETPITSPSTNHLPIIDLRRRSSRVDYHDVVNMDV